MTPKGELHHVAKRAAPHGLVGTGTSVEGRHMAEQQPQSWDEAPTVEVRVFREGQLAHTELCESEAQAALVVERWSELADVRCEVEDLSAQHRPGDIVEPEPLVTGEEDYPPAG